ncbi:Very-long-chain 3-oxoacyl-CoA reductase 1 [Acorus calamus]|uniref:Very-long-chain 3-oxoacyl-CoA reductase 1 n=1 Tax=Acorus calamus TaxID=4465 RepID=A0AAV9F1C3_ACOCL|nr:Very-long-chain 3-oxoacyl-CoA reductase 1 [Acorus calamus]
MEICHYAEDLKQQPTWFLLLGLLGLLSLSKSTFSLLKWLYVTFLRPPKNLIKSYGSWALVTGPTDGIGKAFAFQLARKGLHLVLVGRNPDKLATVSDEIKAEYGKTQINTVVVDLSGDLSEGVRRIREAIEGVDVGVLVNNAGVSNLYGKYVHEMGEEEVERMLSVNVKGMTLVTRVVLEGMLRRGRGAIVNVGSGSVFVTPSSPLFSVYAATKAYIDQFSRSLYVEYKKSGIDVQCQIPLFVATRMYSKRKLTKRPLFVASPEAYARAAIRWIGYEPRVCPYLPHFIQWCLVSLVPEFIVDESRLRFGIRRKYINKDER